MYYGGFTYTEAFNLPTAYKRWWIERISKEMKGPEDNGPNGENRGNSRGAHHNPADVMAMAGRSRTQVPSRMRRFS